ncbi:hypothetical protein O181_000620 [Austropuccinia psidii MF-1]|uniref:Uncharacterized protein n=1 Tax=Austropuccinia psidii MF-1 TaxID=1389203 RepID=A0A9Q3B9D4_9BASI|nr:hypothetical protein [Austropuccinia psidii MF-1]
MPQTLGNSTEFIGQRNSAPESGSEISDMVSSHELGIEVESQSHENNQDPPVLPESQPQSSQKTNFKSYQKEKTVEPCSPTENDRQDDIIFSGKEEELEIAGLEFLKPTEKEAFFNNNIWNIKLMKESAKPPDNLLKSENSFFKMVQSLFYPANPTKHFWENVMFESISLVSYDVIEPKPYVAPTSNSTNLLGLKRGGVEYLASCFSKLKQRAIKLCIEGGGAENEILTKPHKNLEDLMDTVIHLMIAYNILNAHTKVKVYGMKGKLTSSKKMRPSKIF